VESIVEILKSKKGDGSINAIIITLVLFLIFTLVMEYLRIYTIANGVRGAVVSSINTLTTHNADKAFGHFREGSNSMDNDMESVQRMNSLPMLLRESLALVSEDGYVYRKKLGNGATEYVLKDFYISYISQPLVFTARLKLVIPARMAGKIVTHVEIPVIVKSAYQEKY
jgi:hypothetical protein